MRKRSTYKSGILNPHVFAAIALCVATLSGCKRPPSEASTDSQIVASASPTVARVSPSQPSPSEPSRPAFDACALITGEEVEGIMGSPIKDKKNSEHSTGGLCVSQCFYTAAEFSSSVSLAVTQTDATSPAKRRTREFWNETFGRYSNSEENRELDTKNEKPPGKEDEKESTPPKKIEGIGEEAFWTSTRVGGVLYVLKNDSYLRVSVGGADTDEGRLKKCKALAEKALPRL